MIKLYWSPKSRAVRLFWALEEISQPYELEYIDIRQADRIDSSAFMAASPLRKVPALTDGQLNIADSGAIVLYLADRYKPGELSPLFDDPDRGAYLFWLFYAASVMEPAMTEKFVDIPPNPVAYPWGSFDKMVAALDERMKDREWIATDRFTMADFMVSGTIQTLMDFKLHKPSTVLKTYTERCLSRPAAIRGREKEAAATAALST